MNSEIISNNIIVFLPPELLMKIFTYLSGKELIKCREVCSYWNSVIHSMCKSNNLWLEYCKEDFEEIYVSAKQKARPEFGWFQIYKSLSLWSKLGCAREIRDEFASACEVYDEIKNFTLLSNGIVGVHKQNAIIYYDTQTKKISKREPILGHYLRYAENEYLIVTLTYHLQLQIIVKIDNPTYIVGSAVENIKCFLLINKNVYYVTWNDEIMIISEKDRSYKNRKLIAHVEDGVMALGYTNCLNVLTFRRHICCLVDDNLVEVCCLDQSPNPFDQLRHFNFLEHLDWRIYFQWMYVLNHCIPDYPLGDIVTVRSYGDVIFVGSNWGVLRIYHAPNSAGVFDFHSAEPIKQYDFMNCHDCAITSMCPIIQVDVIEAEDGHTLFVAMPKKIAVINYV